jgi:hypothetical protein
MAASTPKPFVVWLLPWIPALGYSLRLLKFIIP